MAQHAIGRRYAQALFDSAMNGGIVEDVERDLKTVDEVFETVPRLERALRTPTISSARKKDLLNTAFGGRVNDLTLRFIRLLVDRRRETVLPEVSIEFHRLSNQFRNILPVQVTSAIALTEGEQEALSQAIARRTGKQILLEAGVDPALMGGVVLRMGDTVVDGSVRTRLEQLRTQLMSGRAELTAAQTGTGEA